MRQYVKIFKDEKNKINNNYRMNRKLSFKAFIISQIVTLLIGLIFLGGLYYILYLQNPLESPKFSFGKFGPVTKEPTTLNLDLTTPDNDTLIFQESIEFSGKTSPNSEVLISSLDNSLVTQSKSDGSFSEDFELIEGTNEIKIVVFDKSGNSKEIERTIYYSKEKL